MVRFTMQFSKEFGKLLKKTAKMTEGSQASVIRSAVGLYSHLLNELKAKPGRTLAIIDEEGNAVTILIVSMI
jgi:hypothetical protein